MHSFYFLLFIIFLINCQIGIYSYTFTERYCNFTEYPKSGCEDSETTTCIDKRCACKEDWYFVIRERFCVEKICPEGTFYDRIKKNCVRQSRASTDVTENHCRFDYHCLGTHVICKRHGWNYNCVCETGFRYDPISETCIAKHGIGGHCLKDVDCDETSLRRMRCDLSAKDDQQKNLSKKFQSGTCQCIDEHRYNYNIDGCEPLSEIAKRASNMRALIFLFCGFGIIGGLVLTCNFNFLGRGAKHPELYLHRIRELERAKRLEQQRTENKMKNEEAQQLKSIDNSTSNTSPSTVSLSLKQNANQMEKINAVSQERSISKKVESSLISF